MIGNAPASGPIGEIRIFAGLTPPGGWLICDGRPLSNADYPELFGVIGTTFGPDSTDQFNIPDFSGRLPVGTDPNAKTDPYPLGTSAGGETVTLVADTLPVHSHALSASSDAAVTNQVSASAVPGGMADAVEGFYVTQKTAVAETVRMAAGTIDPGAPAIGHPNMMPWLALNFIIAAQPKAWDCFDETCRLDGRDVFVGEIRMFGYDDVPLGWAPCDGSSLSMETFWALQCVIADTYGPGTGADIVLPDLAGATMIGAGTTADRTPVTISRTLASSGGANTVPLMPDHTPAHSHDLHAALLPSRGGDALTPSDGNWLGSQSRAMTLFTDRADPAVLLTSPVGNAGAGQPHENRQPYLAVRFCIATDGIFPLSG